MYNYIMIYKIYHAWDKHSKSTEAKHARIERQTGSKPVTH